jgi:hypothetical protein
MQDKLENCLRGLRDARLGEYRNLPPDPQLREVLLALDPLDSHNVQWKRGTGRGTGVQSYLTFELKEPTYVTGVRIKYSGTNALSSVPWLHITWRDSSKNEEFVEPGGTGRRHFHPWLLPSGQEVEIPVWICDTLDQIRIYPDRVPCDFTISEIVLLVPESRPGSEPKSATSVALPAGPRRPPAASERSNAASQGLSADR